MRLAGWFNGLTVKKTSGIVFPEVLLVKNICFATSFID